MIKCKNNRVVDVSRGFISLMEFSLAELIGKKLDEVSQMIRIDSQIMLENIQDQVKAYIFTKSLKLTEVTISCDLVASQNTQILSFKQHQTSYIEEQYNFSQQLYTNRKTGVILFSYPDLVVLKINQGYLDYLGMPYNKKESVIGKSYKEITHPYVHDIMVNYSEYVADNRQPHYVEQGSFQQPTGRVLYWDSSTVPVFEKKEIKYLIHSTLNVTEKVLNQQEIKQKNKELETIIDNISEDLIIIDKDGKLTGINKAARANVLCDFTKYENIKDVFSPFQIFTIDGKRLHHEDRPAQRLMRKERFSSFRIVLIHEEGIQYREASGTPIYDDHNEFIAGVLLFRDITNTLANEENLLIKTQYDLLNRMIENLELGIVRFTYPELEMIDMNHKFFSNFRANQSDVEFEFASFENKETFIKKLNISIEKRDGVYFEIKKVKLLEEERFFKFIYQPLFKLNKKVKEIVVMAVDITEEITARNKLEKILKVQEEVFVNISHEFRTPVNVIFSTCQLIELYLKGDLNEKTKEKIVEKTHSIKQNCNRFIKIINNVIDLSQIESGEANLYLKNENIVKRVKKMVESVAVYVQSKKIDIVFDSKTNQKIIALDIEKIERVILNLISNAIKFSNEGSQICINVRDKGDWVEISVIDQGIGIDERAIPFIFNRFNQTDKSLMRKAEGSGIGLSLAKAIVEMHGGTIVVESKIGKGSTFKVKLPAITMENTQISGTYKEVSTQNQIFGIEFSDIY